MNVRSADRAHLDSRQDRPGLQTARNRHSLNTDRCTEVSDDCRPAELGKCHCPTIDHSRSAVNPCIRAIDSNIALDGAACNVPKVRMVRSLLQSILVHLLRNASARLRMSAESAESAIDVS